MQLPTIDRTSNLRPAGADLASSGANKVIPVAPVNPSVHATPKLEVRQPGVIDAVNPALKSPEVADRVHVAVPDPVQQKSVAEAVPKDWTIHRPQKEKVENPPPKPISQILMDHLKTMWTASASAVQVDQVHNQLTTPTPVTPSQAPGDLAKQAVIYAPSKVKKNETI